LARLNLSRANLRNAVIGDSDLSGADLSGANPGNALFKRAAADQDFLDSLEEHLKGTRRMFLFRAWA
jgi:uncharacterized protein YjbI with pentapeptide repeats